MAVNRGLGKGLSALFSDTDAEYLHSSAANMPEANNAQSAPNGEPLSLPMEKVYPNPGQPRKRFEPALLEELAQSIREHGVIQPILVVKSGVNYMIVAGERRFKAAQIAGLTHIPAYLRTLTDMEVREIALIENLQREDLNPIESAIAIKQLIEKYNFTQEDISRKIGKSRSAVTNLLRMLTLPEEVILLVRQKNLSEGHARALIGIETPFAVALANQAVKDGLSVRDIEKAAAAGKSGYKKGKNRPAETFRQSRELKDLISSMQQIFGTKVSAAGTDSKGRIYIDYFSSDDIERIFEVIDKLK